MADEQFRPVDAASNGRPRQFEPDNLDKMVIAIPLSQRMHADDTRRKNEPAAKPEVFPVIIDLNLDYPGGRKRARTRVRKLINEVMAEQPEHLGQGIDDEKSKYSQQYLFGRLTGAAIRVLVRRDAAPHMAGGARGKKIHRALFRIWLDFAIRARTTKSISTVKADAAAAAFAAFGENVVWAVLDSGIDRQHPHFAAHQNLDVPKPLQHKDFSSLPDSPEHACVDAFGHGTHVAGIIAGEMKATEERPIYAITRSRDETDTVRYETTKLERISGMAPKCKLLSVRVLDDNGDGLASNLIAAISYIQELNGYGRRLLVQGVNMSVGYEFEPDWFACGQSPLCVEVDRLVRSGVVVVAAAGNTGYGVVQSAFRDVVSAGLNLTINDPGNAELAITVGATHRDMPHIYGVSYFSSKGPTGDGRLKPDLVAPGEKILSCATGTPRADVLAEAGAVDGNCDYREDSGTSMAAPHVSGVIAAFLSIRHEFVGRPEEIKRIFVSTATDLKRDRYFQGAGLVDLMRAIQSV